MEKLRTCIVCREVKDGRNMLRIVKNNKGEVFIDESGRQNGRGAYICKNKDCTAKLRKTKALNKSFKTQIDDSVYDKIEEYFGK